MSENWKNINRNSKYIQFHFEKLLFENKRKVVDISKRLASRC